VSVVIILVALAIEFYIPYFLLWIPNEHTIEVSAFFVFTNLIPNTIWDGPMKKAQP